MSDAPELQHDTSTEAPPHKWYSPQTLIPALAMIGTTLVVVVVVIPSIIAARAPVIAAAEAKAAAEASATASKEAVVAMISTEESAGIAASVPMTSVSGEVAAVSTDAPTTAPRATNEPATTAPTNLPTTAPTEIPPTPAPTKIPPTTPTAAPNVTLFYDQDAFTIFNSSGDHVSLEGVSFRGADMTWEASSFGNPVKELPKNRCLRLRDATVGNRTPPAECGGQIHGFREVESSVVFWRGDSFEVLRDGTVIATCQTAAGKCEIHVAQQTG
jgi:hypothetical protein